MDNLQNCDSCTALNSQQRRPIALMIALIIWHLLKRRKQYIHSGVGPYTGQANLIQSKLIIAVCHDGIISGKAITQVTRELRSLIYI
jgi:hypothetical protein